MWEQRGGWAERGDPDSGLRVDCGGRIEEGTRREGEVEVWRQEGMGGSGRRDGWASLAGRLIGRKRALTCSV